MSSSNRARRHPPSSTRIPPITIFLELSRAVRWTRKTERTKKEGVERRLVFLGGGLARLVEERDGDADEDERHDDGEAGDGEHLG